MQITVIGATGKTGNVVALRAIENGHKVRAAVRRPDACADLARLGAEIVAFDLEDTESVESTVGGAEAIYYCSPLPIGHEQPFKVDHAWGRNVISAAQSAGVKHFVLLSAMGPETAPGVELLESKRAIEKDLVDSGLAFTILRPGMFMDTVAMTGPETLLAVGLSWPFSESALIQPIAAADISEVAIRAIDTGPRNRAFDLVGPEA